MSPPDDDTLRDASAERFLRLVQAKRRGTLKVYLGLAAGVGKTYRMLQEAQDLHQHGVHVLLGYVETHHRAETVAQLGPVPLLPRKHIFYKGRALEEMDMEGIEQQRPQVVIVDELAHSNVPGSRHEKRWQDVEYLVQQGISVITAVNVQHLESLHDQVLKITGTDVTERVPDRLLQLADEVVNVDLTVGELRRRLEEGKIYDPGKVPTALANFFQAENLLQLRRLAVREVAQLLGRQVETGAGGAPAVLAARCNDDRLLACINSNDRAAKEIIRKTSRLADRFSAAAWYVLYVQTGPETADRIGLATQRHLLRNLQLATELGAQILRVKDDDIVGAITRVAAEKNATLLVCGITSDKGLWGQISRRGVTNDLLRAVARSNQDLDIYLVTY
ncbi:two-component system, OmpR family, sensor histidine kinase KdpD [Hymenobacter gelipurpurascens]|uniref:Two-component system, OmpR family, sensor histidine kinase KdpD n=1 Tax=Hymenobacter gelipurpurascens TaxID=89968 RepID=A0A212UH45_9BACT|nr:histidine kinase [Hymenobacter gelipurpurascens]SNC77572.1 two-component system, OmpR family, sensor histidine kinase KdpD [Hymenobacter gelipurpurascens]